MIPEISHILHEDDVSQLFYIVHNNTSHQIAKPDNWDDIDAVIDINEEFFNVDDFIIGDNIKIKFLQYVENSGYDIIKDIYNNEGGDAQIIFKWIAEKGDKKYDLLGDGFEINLNKYSETFEKSMMAIETEIKKRESQSKLLNREDVSVNLLSEKDLDNSPISPVQTENIYFKERGRKKSNFYFYSLDQKSYTNLGKNEFSYFPKKTNEFFFLFNRSNPHELGDNTNDQFGYENKYVGYYQGSPFGWEYRQEYRSKGDIFYTKTNTLDLEMEISNFNVFVTNEDKSFPKFKLILETINGGTVTRTLILAESTDFSLDNFNGSRIEIKNKIFKIGKLKAGDTLRLKMVADYHLWFRTLNEQTSITVSEVLPTPLRSVKIVRLKDAIDQICRLCTGGEITLQSKLLNQGGWYYDSGVSNRLFMHNDIFQGNKITTSLKSLLYDSTAPLLAAGYDIQEDKMVVEDIGYFFKDIQTYDLSGFSYIEEDYKVENDASLSFNQLMFGSKKYSTGSNNDMQNSNTELEALTPVKSVKNKMDKKTDFVIDEFKIQSIILDNSNSSKNTDDDLIFIDLVFTDTYTDTAILYNVNHQAENGKLVIYSYEIPFDTFPLKAGDNITIEGDNAGTWQIISLTGTKMTLNKTSNIVVGDKKETPIRYTVTNFVKSRNLEGFNILGGEFESKETFTNIRHNPKFQMARWFPYYGSGLHYKADDEEIIVTEYKNNGTITIQPNSDDLDNELQGVTEYKANERLGRLRAYKKPFFSGKKIEVTIPDVYFHTFFEIYSRWRYGIDGDSDRCRGFITVPTPDGNVDVYPFGKGFEYNSRHNELTIRGKVKN